MIFALVLVRGVAFPGDKRKLMDFRRSGAVEATGGKVDPAALAGKMANTIDQSKELQAAYLPHNTTLVRLADDARRSSRPNGSSPSSQGLASSQAYSPCPRGLRPLAM
jgi:hypothetical protein